MGTYQQSPSSPFTIVTPQLEDLQSATRFSYDESNQRYHNNHNVKGGSGVFSSIGIGRLDNSCHDHDVNAIKDATSSDENHMLLQTLRRCQERYNNACKHFEMRERQMADELLAAMDGTALAAAREESKIDKATIAELKIRVDEAEKEADISAIKLNTVAAKLITAAGLHIDTNDYDDAVKGVHEKIIHLECRLAEQKNTFYDNVAAKNDETVVVAKDSYKQEFNMPVLIATSPKFDSVVEISTLMSDLSSSWTNLRVSLSDIVEEKSYADLFFSVTSTISSINELCRSSTVNLRHDNSHIKNSSLESDIRGTVLLPSELDTLDVDADGYIPQDMPALSEFVNTEYSDDEECSSQHLTKEFLAESIRSCSSYHTACASSKFSDEEFPSMSLHVESNDEMNGEFEFQQPISFGVTEERLLSVLTSQEKQLTRLEGQLTELGETKERLERMHISGGSLIHEKCIELQANNATLSKCVTAISAEIDGIRCNRKLELEQSTSTLAENIEERNINTFSNLRKLITDLDTLRTSLMNPCTKIPDSLVQQLDSGISNIQSVLKHNFNIQRGSDIVSKNMPERILNVPSTSNIEDSTVFCDVSSMASNDIIDSSQPYLEIRGLTDRVTETLNLLADEYSCFMATGIWTDSRYTQRDVIDRITSSKTDLKRLTSIVQCYNETSLVSRYCDEPYEDRASSSKYSDELLNPSKEQLLKEAQRFHEIHVAWELRERDLTSRLDMNETEVSRLNELLQSETQRYELLLEETKLLKCSLDEHTTIAEVNDRGRELLEEQVLHYEELINQARLTEETLIHDHGERIACLKEGLESAKLELTESQLTIKARDCDFADRLATAKAEADHLRDLDSQRHKYELHEAQLTWESREYELTNDLNRYEAEINRLNELLRIEAQRYKCSLEEAQTNFDDRITVVKAETQTRKRDNDKHIASLLGELDHTKLELTKSQLALETRNCDFAERLATAKAEAAQLRDLDTQHHKRKHHEAQLTWESCERNFIDRINHNEVEMNRLNELLQAETQCCKRSLEEIQMLKSDVDKSVTVAKVETENLRELYGQEKVRSQRIFEEKQTLKRDLDERIASLQDAIQTSQLELKETKVTLEVRNCNFTERLDTMKAETEHLRNLDMQHYKCELHDAQLSWASRERDLTNELSVSKTEANRLRELLETEAHRYEEETRALKRDRDERITIVKTDADRSRELLGEETQHCKRVLEQVQLTEESMKRDFDERTASFQEKIQRSQLELKEAQVTLEVRNCNFTERLDTMKAETEHLRNLDMQRHKCELHDAQLTWASRERDLTNELSVSKTEANRLRELLETEAHRYEEETRALKRDLDERITFAKTDAERSRELLREETQHCKRVLEQAQLTEETLKHAFDERTAILEEKIQHSQLELKEAQLALEARNCDLADHLVATTAEVKQLRIVDVHRLEQHDAQLPWEFRERDLIDQLSVSKTEANRLRELLETEAHRYEEEAQTLKRDLDERITFAKTDAERSRELIREETQHCKRVMEQAQLTEETLKRAFDERTASLEEKIQRSQLELKEAQFALEARDHDFAERLETSKAAVEHLRDTDRQLHKHEFHEAQLTWEYRERNLVNDLDSSKAEVNRLSESLLAEAQRNEGALKETSTLKHDIDESVASLKEEVVRSKLELEEQVRLALEARNCDFTERLRDLDRQHHTLELQEAQISWESHKSELTNELSISKRECRRLQTENQQHMYTLEKNEAELHLQLKEVSLLQTRLATSEREFDRIRTSIRSLCGSGYDDRDATIDSSIQIVYHRIEKLHAECVEHERSLISKDAQLKELSRQRDDAILEIARVSLSVQSQLPTYEALNSDFTKRLDNITEEKGNLEARLLYANASVDEQRVELQRMSNEIEQLLCEKGDAEKHLRDLHDFRLQLTAAVTNAEENEIQSRKIIQEDTVAATLQRIVQCPECTKNLKDRDDALMRITTLESEVMILHDKLKDTVESSSITVQTLRNEIDSALMEASEDAANERVVLRNEASASLAAVISNQREELASLHEELSSALAATEMELSDAHEEIVSLNARILEGDRNLEQLMFDNADAIRAVRQDAAVVLESMKSENVKALNKERSISQEALKASKEHMNVILYAEKERIEVLVAEKENMVREMTAVCADLDDERKDYEMQAVSLKDEIKTKSTEYEAAVALLESRAAELEASRKMVSRLSSDLEHQREKNSSLLKLIDTLFEENDERMKALYRDSEAKHFIVENCRKATQTALAERILALQRADKETKKASAISTLLADEQRRRALDFNIMLRSDNAIQSSTPQPIPLSSSGSTVKPVTSCEELSDDNDSAFSHGYRSSDSIPLSKHLRSPFNVRKATSSLAQNRKLCDQLLRDMDVCAQVL